MSETKKPFPLAKGERLTDVRRAQFSMSRRLVAPEEASKRGFIREDDDGRKLYEVAISSETEIQRWFGIEVLSHAPGAVDMSRINGGAAVLVDHGGDQIGKVMNGTARIDEDRVQRGWVRFSKSARGQEIEQDVADETRENISVGYMVLDWAVEMREAGKDENGKPAYEEVYRVTRWQPAEVSIVSVPADLTVGVGRSAAGVVPEPAKPEAQAPAPARKETSVMEPEKKDESILITDARSATEVARDKDRAEIFRICDANGMGGRAPEFIEQGLSLAEVALEIVKIRRNVRDPAIGAPHGGDNSIMKNLKLSDRKRYSYARAILLAAGANDRRQKWDGIEAEVHQELQKHYSESGLSMRSNGFLLPVDLRTPEQAWQDMERRALDSKTVTKGSEAVFEQPGELIELLRNRSAVVALGARTLTGLSGPIGFPKQTGAGTASWVGENPGTDLSDSDLALGLVMMQPKTIQSTTAYARQLLVQSSVDIENLVRNDLALIHALAWDKAAFHGTSAAGQPTGIYVAPDVPFKAHGGNPDLVLLIDQAAKVADANADEGSLGWVTTPLMAAKMMSTAEHDTAAAANWVWRGTFREGTMAGYPARGTNQISKTMVDSAPTGGSEHGIIFGNWADMIIGMFGGGIEIVVDPYAKKKQALIEVTSFQLTDLILRHGESFSKSHGATIA